MTVPAKHRKTSLSSTIVKKPNSLYFDKYKGYTIALNTSSDKGLGLLNKEAMELLDFIDGKKTISEMYKILKKQDKELTYSYFKSLITTLVKLDLIFLGEDKKNIKKNHIDELNIWLHLTNSCNLRCKYCYVNKNDEIMNMGVAEAAIDAAFYTVEKYGFKKMTIKFAGGEPLLRLDFIYKIFDYAQKSAIGKSLDVKYVILTNGTLVTDHIAKELKKLKIHAAVSLDGIEDSHNEVRPYANGKPSYKEVIKGLLALKKRKVPVNITIVVTRINIDHIIPLIKKMRKIDVPLALVLVREDCSNEKSMLYDFKTFDEGFKKIFRYLARDIPDHDIFNRYLSSNIRFRDSNFSCGCANSYIAIMPDGQIKACQTDYRKFGNILEVKDPLAKFRLDPLYHGMKLSTNTDCKNCIWLNICGSGCKLINEKANKYLASKSPCCKLFKKYIPELIKLEANRILKYEN